MTDQPPRRTVPAKTVAGAAAIAAVVLAVTPFVTSKEGEVDHVYKDGGGTATYCVGETQDVEYRIYTHGECMDRLRTRLAHDYAPAIIDCVPAFVDPARRKPFEALVDASYNAGFVGACKSPMARYFNAGQWAKGCDAFLTWRATIHGQPSKGLRNRRAAERLLCLGKV